ncbi:MAG: peptidoglycan DD-metalloendopeptidase family protein [Rhizobiales bacterium]|nr:peptidoglycan DD-metalloendopeptidase family protein [Hyphomicrobiales bacterium]
MKRFLTAVLLAQAFGMSPVAAGVDEPSSKLGRINQQIEQSQSRRKALRDELQALQLEEEQISGRLVNLASRIQGREAMITASERRIAALEVRQSRLRASLDDRREALTQLLAGLQRLERNKPPPLATRPDDAMAAIRGAMLFGAVVPAVNAETAALSRTLAEMDAIQARHKAERTELGEHLAKLEVAHKQMAGLQARKIALIKQTDTDLLAEAERAEKLAEKAKSLKQLLAALAEERKRREAKSKIEAKTAAKAGPETVKKPKKRRLARLSFKSVRGKMDYPVQGRLLRRFGEKDDFGNDSKGIYIATRRQGQVTAPVAGRVEYAGDFRSYGKLLILDVGQGYHVLFAGLAQLSAQTGQDLQAGEPIGRMGNTSARGTLIGETLDINKPILYVEFRIKGQAIDSSSWWIGNRKEARR